MARPVLYLAATGHGFGHAVRVASIAAAVQQVRPDILLVLATPAPRWLLASYLCGDFIHRPRALDVGVVQSDGLNMDKEATLAEIRHLRRRQEAIVAGEVNFLRNNRAGLMVADIPPLAAPIARAAGIPSWMVGNFGWDFIYRDWGGEFVEIAAWIAGCYQQCDRLFRLPMSEPMEGFPHLTEAGLTGGKPRYSAQALTHHFPLNAPPERTVLLTFGGLGLQQIPYHNLQRFPDWQFISFDAQAPALPNLLKVANSHCRPVDLMPVCGRVVSKPGFSTFAEAMRLGVPIVSLTREDFAEAPFLLAGIENYAWHQIVTPEEFFQGDWGFLHQPLAPPRRGDSIPKDGTETIARAVVEYFS